MYIRLLHCCAPLRGTCRPAMDIKWGSKNCSKKITICILCGFMLLVEVCSDTHSLQYYFTTVSGANTGVSLYSVAGYVDDVQISRYTGNFHHVQPLFQWMDEKIDHEHWVKQTYLARHYEELHKQDMNVMKGLFNRTYGSLVTHVYQVKFACELFEDGSIRGYEEFGFNGKEFIIFDKERMVFVPATQEAQIITQKWNSQQFSAQIHKEHMEKDCVEWINKYLHYGKDILERKVPPKVKVSRRQLNGVSKLHCQVYGFYPRAVDVKWVKNGMEDVPSEEDKQILPNPDGTFQIRVSVEVPLGEDSYECHVDHESLDVPLNMVLWEEEQHTNFVLIGLFAALAVVIVAAIIGFIMYRRRSGQVINRSETESVRVAE